VPAQEKKSAPFNIQELHLATGGRIILLLAFIAFQITILKFVIHPPMNGGGLSIQGGRFLALLYFILGFMLLLSGHFARVRQELIGAAEHHRWQRMILPQLISYFLIIYCASKLYPTDIFAFNEHIGKHKPLWLAAITVSIITTSLFSLTLIAPKAYWRHFFKTEKTTFLLALTFPAIHIAVYSFATRAHDVLSTPTIKVAKFILGLFYTDIWTDLDKAMLGRPNYAVIVDQMCSGYAGIGMITVFLIWYLSTFKNKLRFPAAFLVFPIGAALIWLSNCLRVALIVAIGSSLSTEIAIEGFHANAGWIFFIAVSVIMVAMTRNFRFFNKEVADRIIIDSVNALVIPFLVMLAATLIASSLSPQFQWLYPIRAIATALAILLVWKHIKLAPVSPAAFPVIAGIVVFLLWIFLIPPSVEGDRKFSAALSGVPTFVSTGWIVIRLLGSVFVIPIAEELAFRGYLPVLFTGGKADKDRSWETHLLPFALSSLLFGALHTSMLAGTLAGVVYYLVKLRSGSLRHAIIAHMTSNFLISVYVLLSGHWSYW